MVQIYIAGYMYQIVNTYLRTLVICSTYLFISNHCESGYGSAVMGTDKYVPNWIRHDGTGECLKLSSQLHRARRTGSPNEAKLSPMDSRAEYGALKTKNARRLTANDGASPHASARG